LQAPEPQQSPEHWSQPAHAQVLVWAARVVVSAMVDSARARMQKTARSFDFIFFSSEFRLGRRHSSAALVAQRHPPPHASDEQAL
jgi:hypothetical protein